MDALQVIAEPKRRQILALIWNREMAAGDIAGEFNVSFGAVSQHLGILRDARFVTIRKQGNCRFYRADLQALGPLRSVLETMWEDKLDQLEKSIEDFSEVNP